MKQKVFCDDCVLTIQSKELEAVLELAGNGISIIDRTGRFLYSNRSFLQMTGYTMEELKKESCVSLATPEYQLPSLEAIAYAIKHGMIQNFKKVCKTKDGRHIHAYMSLSYIKERDVLVMVSADISDEHAYMEKLEAEVKEKVEAYKKQHEVMQQRNKLAAMGEMINSIAHQWRQPLNTLGLISQSLLHQIRTKKYDDKSLLEIHRSMMEKIGFLSQTIDDFYNFFKPSITKSSFSIKNGIDEVISLVTPELNDSRISLEIIHCSSNPHIYGLQNEFKHVILNLVSNAKKAIMKSAISSGAITIKSHCKNRTVCVEVCDNGGGIKYDTFKTLFEPYVSEDGGTGIGLYMSKVIIEEHMGGKIQAFNKDDGACFVLSFEGLKHE